MTQQTINSEPWKELKDWLNLLRHEYINSDYCTILERGYGGKVIEKVIEKVNEMEKDMEEKMRKMDFIKNAQPEEYTKEVLSSPATETMMALETVQKRSEIVVDKMSVILSSILPPSFAENPIDCGVKRNTSEFPPLFKRQYDIIEDIHDNLSKIFAMLEQIRLE